MELVSQVAMVTPIWKSGNAQAKPSLKKKQETVQKHVRSTTGDDDYQQMTGFTHRHMDLRYTSSLMSLNVQLDVMQINWIHDGDIQQRKQ